MFDNLSDRFGVVFDKLRGHQAFQTKVGTGFVVWKRANTNRAPLIVEGSNYV